MDSTGPASVSTNASRLFVEAGLGYSVLPWPTREGPVRNGVKAIRQTGPGTTFPISALWRKRALPDPIVATALAIPFGE